MTKRKDAVKRAIVVHLAGMGGKSGLAMKALERLWLIIDQGDDALALAAIDKVVKLLPYAISREDLGVLPGSNGTLGQPVNIQINFDQQMRDRLQGTHLSGLMDNFIVSRDPLPKDPQG